MLCVPHCGHEERVGLLPESAASKDLINKFPIDLGLASGLKAKLASRNHSPGKTPPPPPREVRRFYKSSFL
jgi:hypothetical protein